MLGHGPVFIVEFFVVRKTELWKQIIHLLCRWVSIALAYSKNLQCYNNTGPSTALRTKEVIHMDSNNLSHTKWNCKYHIYCICTKIQKENYIWTVETGHSEYIKHAMQKKRGTHSRSRDVQWFLDCTGDFWNLCHAMDEMRVDWKGIGKQL